MMRGFVVTCCGFVPKLTERTGIGVETMMRALT